MATSPSPTFEFLLKLAGCQLLHVNCPLRCAAAPVALASRLQEGTFITKSVKDHRLPNPSLKSPESVQIPKDARILTVPNYWTSRLNNDAFPPPVDVDGQPKLALPWQNRFFASNLPFAVGASDSRYGYGECADGGSTDSRQDGLRRPLAYVSLVVPRFAVCNLWCCRKA